MKLSKPVCFVTRPKRGSLSALGSALRIAADRLWAHKLRSFLTVLGIVIGIAAVVLVGAAVEALREYAITTTAQAFGSNTFPRSLPYHRSGQSSPAWAFPASWA